MEHNRHEIIVQECTPSYGKIALEPLERGYGTTLGNSLRRVLLSSIPGAAISAVRIEGILHEFSTIPGVREDVIELLVNLKNVPLKCYNRDLKTLRLEAEGPKCVVASDIEPDADIEFVDPDAVICNIEAGHTVSMNFYVEQGIGYASIDRPRPAYLPVDALLIDSVFSPVKRVRYEVQDKRMGQRTDYDRLVLELWTNGAIAPDEAISQAAGILDGYFRELYVKLGPDALAQNTVTMKEAPEKEETPPKEKAPQFEDAQLGRPIRDLELSVRSENCLLRGNVHVVGDLIGRTREDLLKIRNLGKISLHEIEEKLKKFGLGLEGSPIEDIPDSELEYEDEEYALKEENTH